MKAHYTAVNQIAPSILKDFRLPQTVALLNFVLVAMSVLLSPVFADDNSPGALNQIRDRFDDDYCEYWYNTDTDNDGLTDCEEFDLGTDHTKKDTDGDSISDWQETIDKSSPLDRGSYIIPLDTTVCSEWNGFLQMWNIYEHVNMSSSSLGITTTLYNLNGIGVSDQYFGIANGAQYDLLVHDMPGHTTNSYGAVCSSHNGEKGSMDGRMVYYKQDFGREGSWRGHFQFALAMPMSNGRPRKQFVPFNTYRSDGQNTLVANWIQLTNLSTSSVRGNLSFRAMDGSELGSFTVRVPAGSRRDFPGHQYGSNLVGLVVWSPESETDNFQFRNVRYVYDNPEMENSFETAFQVEGRHGTGETLVALLDTCERSPILEISNVHNQNVYVDVVIYDSEGVQKYNTRLNLNSYASHHIMTESILGTCQRGIATIDGSMPESVIAEAMHYGHDYFSGPYKNLSYMYGVPAAEALGGKLRGSYNNFLDQTSVLVLMNPTANVQNVSIAVDGAITAEDGSHLPSTMSVPAHGSRMLSLGYYTVPNTYGTVTVQPAVSGTIVSWVLRQRYNDYVIPTPVRQ